MKFKNKNLVNLKGEKIDVKTLLNQLDKDIRDIKFLQETMDDLKNDLIYIKIELQQCTDIREYRVIETHLNNTMKQLDEYNTRYDKLIARCERRRKVCADEKNGN